MMSNTTPSRSLEKGDGGMEMSAEMQRAAFRWQQDQLQISQFSQHLQHSQQLQQQSHFSDFSMLALQGAGDTLLNELFMNRPVKANPGMDPGYGSGWPEYGFAASATTTTVDCSGADHCSGSGHGVVKMMGKESFKKRKAENKTLQFRKKVEAEEQNRAKKVKRCPEEKESALMKVNQQNGYSGNSKTGNKESRNKEVSGGPSKDNSEASEVQKPDYIHVRARRGQATDSHSLAERVRREKISERMKYLQGLVPGCNKITGKAGMLDEIINYVQSLQQQVELLSMKLAAVVPKLDNYIEDFFAKEIFPACSSNFPAMGVSSEMTNIAHLQYNPEQKMGPVCGSISGMSQLQMGFRRSISSPVSIPETLLESSCVTHQIQSCLPWDQSDLQSIYSVEYQQAREESFDRHIQVPTEAGWLN